jgi:hypothetical protein
MTKAERKRFEKDFEQYLKFNKFMSNLFGIKKDYLKEKE